jgi:hypothetical protein
MTRYAVFCDEDLEVICKSRADAEEFILSCAEEEAYEEFAYDLNHCYSSAKEFFSDYLEAMGTVNANRRRYNPTRHRFVNVYAYCLSQSSSYYHIETAEELD